MGYCVIEKLQLKHFTYVKMPSRRTLFNQLQRAGMVRTHSYSSDEVEGDYGNAINFTDGMNKVDMLDTGSSLLNQSKAIHDSKKKDSK